MSVTPPSSQLRWALGITALSALTVVLTTLRSDHFDDAFITYTFARHVADGHGFTWVVGESPVFGATSILYTLLLAAGGMAGVGLPAASVVLSTTGWAAAHGLLFLLLARHAGVFPAAAAAILSVATAAPARLSLGMESGLFVAIAFLALLLYESRAARSAGVAAAVATLARPEGVLLFIVFAARGVIDPRLPDWRSRAKATASSALPGLALLCLCGLGEFAYFGTVVPHTVTAKLSFGCAVSGCFSLSSVAAALTAHVGAALAVALLLGAGLGIVRAATLGVRTVPLVFLFGVLYLVAFVAGQAPDSPWYVAVLLPIVCGGFVYGLAAGRGGGALVSRVGRGAVVAAVFAVAGMTALEIMANPLGAQSQANRERRQLASAVLQDLKARGRTEARVLAHEVGVLGYTLPGRVDDLLGLVTPGFQPCLRGEDGDAVLAAQEPDYVIIVDDPQYIATACIQRAASLRTGFAPILSVPLPYGHSYVAYRRVSTP